MDEAEHSTLDHGHRISLKRTRQACEPCRRKKSKCSGERPVCATCARLRARCSYAIEPGYGPHTTAGSSSSQLENSRHTTAPRPAASQSSGQTGGGNAAVPEAWSQSQYQARLESLESTLAQVVAGLGSWRSNEMPTPEVDHSPAMMRRASMISRRENRENADDAFALPWDQAPDIAQLYLRYCDCQPLPLFQQSDFASTFANRDVGVVYGVFALASRFSDRHASRVGPSPQDARMYAFAAQRQAMTQVSSGRIELATLQTLCLVSLAQFQAGDLTQARINGSLVTTLAQSACLGREHAGHRDSRLTEERRRCYWSIVLLQRLTGEGSMVNHLAQPHLQPLMPTSATTPATTVRYNENGPMSTGHGNDMDDQDGIIHVVIKLSEVWSLAQTCIQDRGISESGLPPWSTDSSYSKALEAIMSLGAQLPSAHRYRSMRLSSMKSCELNDARDYWGPWLLSRFLYHTSICILNHPIIVMLQLQGFQNVPELFLQQTTFQRDHHTSWLLHFIDFLISRRYFISDPIIPYCAAVLATIELHQSFYQRDKHRKDGMTQQQKHYSNYNQCLSFIIAASNTWSCLDLVAKRLEHLREGIENSFQADSDQGSDRAFINISSFFAILDITRVYNTEHRPGTSGSIFGASLAFQVNSEPQRNDLQPLPHITEMESSNDSSVRSGRPSEPRNPEPVDAESASVPQDGFMDIGLPEEGLMFPVDQIFGHGLFSSRTDPWDVLTAAPIDVPDFEMNTAGGLASL